VIFPTVPLSFNHCHSPRHCRPPQSMLPLPLQKKFKNHCHFFNRLQLCQYCHYQILTGTIRTALISSIERHHSHPATATPHPTAAVYNLAVVPVRVAFYHGPSGPEIFFDYLSGGWMLLIGVFGGVFGGFLWVFW
jgi:hypothetical protein